MRPIKLSYFLRAVSVSGFGCATIALPKNVVEQWFCSWMLKTHKITGTVQKTATSLFMYFVVVRFFYMSNIGGHMRKQLDFCIMEQLYELLRRLHLLRLAVDVRLLPDSAHLALVAESFPRGAA